MKLTKTITRLLACILATLSLLPACREEVDTSARYTFTGQTITGYLESHPQYSQYVDVLNHSTASPITRTNLRQLLSARGNYTVFAPTNEAIGRYLEQLTREGLLSEPTWDGFPNDHVRDSVCEVIAKNSIIDGGDIIFFETTQFPNEENGEFPLANMNDRKLTVRYAGADTIFINQRCMMDMRNRDIPAINGVLHAMQDVIAPSDISLGHLLDSIMVSNRRGFLVAARVVAACGLRDTLNKIRDERYEEKYLRGEIEDMDGKALGWVFHGASGHPTAYAPQHRKYGFTLFAETDDFWAEALGRDPQEIQPADVQQWVLEHHQYTEGDRFTVDDNYTSPDNLLYQWITYHLLPMRIPTNKLVFHVNEKGFNWRNSTNLTIPVMEFYSTMGKRRLLKIYESAESKGIYLNRFPTLDNGRQGTYHELYCDADKVGCRISTEGDQVLEYSALNGMIYAIDAPLAYTDQVRENLSQGRIRFDAMSLFPEAMNNDQRKKESTDYRDQFVHIPCNSVYHYWENMDQNDNTHFVYLNSYGYDWCNLQADELKACGQYDITIKLPPVPRKDTYELRYRILADGNRGVVQFYFGSDKDRMRPTDIPVDLRILASNPITGWEPDTGDEEYDSEVDKKMRNNHRMKGENAVQNSSGTGRVGNSQICRYILTRQELDPDKTYYLRMKSVLESEITEFYMDYLEWCPKEVYDNPAVPEDIW